MVNYDRQQIKDNVDITQFLVYDNVSIDDMITFLQKIKNRDWYDPIIPEYIIQNSALDWQYFDKIGVEQYYDQFEIYLYGERMETDQEMDIRIKKEERSEKRRLARKNNPSKLKPSKVDQNVKSLSEKYGVDYKVMKKIIQESKNI